MPTHPADVSARRRPAASRLSGLCFERLNTLGLLPFSENSKMLRTTYVFFRIVVYLVRRAASGFHFRLHFATA